MKVAQLCGIKFKIKRLQSFKYYEPAEYEEYYKPIGKIDALQILKRVANHYGFLTITDYLKAWESNPKEMKKLTKNLPIKRRKSPPEFIKNNETNSSKS